MCASVNKMVRYRQIDPSNPYTARRGSSVGSVLLVWRKKTLYIDSFKSIYNFIFRTLTRGEFVFDCKNNSVIILLLVISIDSCVCLVIRP